MRQIIGVLASHQIAAAKVAGGRLQGTISFYPESGGPAHVLDGMPAEEITRCILQQIDRARAGAGVSAAGVALPGIAREGIVLESPNLPQIKGLRLQETLAAALQQTGEPIPVRIFNDSDAMAAGLASIQGSLDKLIRVWYLGHGVGFGRYPWTDGVWEGGHSVVSLDAKERFCACGGRGHLEGIMGVRAMRLRFLDLEPEEVFESARTGDKRCGDFVKLWHRALAAATATSISMEGPGKFFLTGPNARLVELPRLDIDLRDMVKMSALQGSQFEVVETDFETGIIGAAVNAEIATEGSG
ncbi:MAG: ROK family protein [Terriglobia bacterium]